MALTLLIFALTIQNYFIFRNFWDRTSASNPDASGDFKTRFYDIINYINFGNDPQVTFQYTSASYIDAVGACLAMYAAFSAVMGSVGLG